MASEPVISASRPDRWSCSAKSATSCSPCGKSSSTAATASGDPDHASIYGLKPHEWYAGGVRILGRTAVECTPDRLADLIGRDVAAVARAAPAALPMVVDCPPGRATRLPRIQRHTGARRAIGFELDDVAFELAGKTVRIAAWALI
jgi:hypothetical protein